MNSLDLYITGFVFGALFAFFMPSLYNRLIVIGNRGDRLSFSPGEPMKDCGYYTCHCTLVGGECPGKCGKYVQTKAIQGWNDRNPGSPGTVML